MSGAGHVRGTLEAAIRRAGLTPWAKMFQACRSSYEKEWAMTFPRYAVSKWIGHGPTISGRHYVNDVPDELFDRAAAATHRRRKMRRSNQRQTPASARKQCTAKSGVKTTLLA